jgi:hypothetical protein
MLNALVSRANRPSCHNDFDLMTHRVHLAYVDAAEEVREIISRRRAGGAVDCERRVMTSSAERRECKDRLEDVAPGGDLSIEGNVPRVKRRSRSRPFTSSSAKGQTKT